MSNFSNEERQVVPGALRGYRQWFVEPGVILKAMNFPYHWTRGPNLAICQNQFLHFNEPKHQVPTRSCTCGFYALHGPAELNTGPHVNIVNGVIKAYGNVVLGTQGFRAQYAEVEALVARGGGLLLREALAQVYQVPVFPTWNELLEQFPPIPVGELLEQEPAATPPPITAAQFRQRVAARNGFILEALLAALKAGTVKIEKESPEQ